MFFLSQVPLDTIYGGKIGSGSGSANSFGHQMVIKWSPGGQKLPENTWFVWSKTCYNGHQVVTQWSPSGQWIVDSGCQNIWFAWSIRLNSCYKGEKLRGHACNDDTGQTKESRAVFC